MSDFKQTQRDVGAYFGYPKCCIEAFITMEHVGGEPRPLHGTGFIPCTVCAATYTDEELIEIIRANRKCEVPFPNARLRTLLDYYEQRAKEDQNGKPLREGG